MNIVSGSVRLWYTFKETGSTSSGSTQVNSAVVTPRKPPIYSTISPENPPNRHFACFHLLAILFSGLTLGLLLVSLLTCQSTKAQCLPQLQVTLKNTSETSQTVLKAINDLARVFVYLAQEFTQTDTEIDGARLLTNTSYHDTRAQWQGLSTFLAGNTFQLGFLGYCRKTPSTSCEGGLFNGIDVIATLVRDLGIHLVNTTKPSEPDSVVDALVMAYEISLPNVARISEDRFPVRSMMLMKSFSRVVPLVCAVTVSLEALVFLEACAQCAQCAILARHRHNHHRHHRTCLDGALLLIAVRAGTCLAFGMITAVLGALAAYVTKLDQQLDSAGLAQVKLGLGYTMLCGCFVCLAGQGVVVMMRKATT